MIAPSLIGYQHYAPPSIFPQAVPQNFYDKHKLAIVTNSNNNNNNSNKVVN